MHLAFYRGEGDAITWAIRKLTGSPYSHVALMFSDGRTAECTGKPCWRSTGVRWRSERWDKRPDELTGDWDLVPVRATAAQERRVRSFVDAHLGQRFSWRGVLSFLAPRLTGRLEEVGASSQTGWICTTFAMAAMHSAGLLADVPMNLCPGSLIEALDGAVAPRAAYSQAGLSGKASDALRQPQCVLA